MFAFGGTRAARSSSRHNPQMQRVDTHVHLWSAEELPPWLNDPTLASIACSRSIADFVSEAGPNLGSAVYMEVDVAPAARQREAQTVTALCADGSNPLVGAVIGAPVVEGTVEEFASFVREWAGNRFVKGVRQVLHIHPPGTCLRNDVVAKAQLCGEDLNSNLSHPNLNPNPNSNRTPNPSQASWISSSSCA